LKCFQIKLRIDAVGKMPFDIALPSFNVRTILLLLFHNYNGIYSKMLVPLQ